MQYSSSSSDGEEKDEVVKQKQIDLVRRKVSKPQPQQKKITFSGLNMKKSFFQHPSVKKESKKTRALSSSSSEEEEEEEEDEEEQKQLDDAMVNMLFILFLEYDGVVISIVFDACLIYCL